MDLFDKRPMKRIQLLLLAAACAGAGCGSEPSPVSPLPDPGPLTVEEWRQLPIEEKYDDGTFQRLKKHNPKLASRRLWDKFMREVVIPERKRDIPGVPGG